MSSILITNPLEFISNLRKNGFQVFAPLVTDQAESSYVLYDSRHATCKNPFKILVTPALTDGFATNEVQVNNCLDNPQDVIIGELYMHQNKIVDTAYFGDYAKLETFISTL